MALLARNRPLLKVGQPEDRPTPVPVKEDMGGIGQQQQLTQLPEATQKKRGIVAAAADWLALPPLDHHYTGHACRNPTVTARLACSASTAAQAVPLRS